MQNPATTSRAHRVLGIIALTLGLVSSVHAKTIHVETTLDNDVAPASKCTLRDAISSANTDTAVGSCKAGKGADQILLTKGQTYVLSVAGCCDQNNLTGDLDIRSELVIEGRGSTIDAKQIDRVMDIWGTGDLKVAGFPVHLYDLTLTGGKVDSAGGGVRLLSGQLFGDGLVVTGNQALVDPTARGGGIYVYGGNDGFLFGNPPGDELGTSLTLWRSEISNNEARYPGGGLICEQGGKPGNRSQCSLYETVIRNNKSGDWGGGLFAQGGSDVVLQDCVVTDNSATGTGGGMALGNPHALAPDGVILSVLDSTFRKNTAPFGGGMFLRSNADATKPHAVSVIRSTIADNTATSDGGGMNIQARGTGQYSIRQSTISGNAAGGNGGGLYLTSLPITIANSTVSGNTSGSTAAGIANLSTSAAGLLNLVNSTVVDNRASNAVAGACTAVLSGKFGGSPIELKFANNIISGNRCTLGAGSNANCAAVGGVHTSLGYNLDSVNQCNFNAVGDFINTDPLLGPIANNGGPTWTHALLAGSPAIDMADDLVAAGPPVNGIDQRGLPRPPSPDKGASSAGLHADIGAYEFGSK